MSFLVGLKGREKMKAGTGTSCVLLSACGSRIVTTLTSGSKNGTCSTPARGWNQTLWSSGPEGTAGRAGMTLELPWPPSVNTYWRNWRGHMVISTAGRQYTKAVQEQVEKQGTQTYTGPIRVVIQAFRPDRRKRDLDNLLKATLDALTKAGTWEDDSQIVDLRIYWAGMGGKLIVEIFDDGASNPANHAGSAEGVEQRPAQANDDQR